MTQSLLMTGDMPVTQTATPEPRFATIALATGVTLHYLEQGDPQGEPVIMLHGTSDSWNSFAPVLPHLSVAYHVFALDQRGHGDSSKPADGYTMAEFAADVVAFMDAQGIAKATVLGHSMGSMIAQLTAIHYPDRVARLVLAGSMVTVGNPGLLEFNASLQTLTDPVDLAFVRAFQVSTVNQPIPPEFLEKVIAESLKVPAHVWRQMVADFVKQDTTAQLPTIMAPTLIVRGGQDTYWPLSDQQLLAQAIPQSTLHIYEGAGHAVHWEQSERFVADLERFLEATSLLPR
ncbi:MAG: alpha/beta hydrolase [Caldilineaceae bacterium]